MWMLFLLLVFTIVIEIIVLYIIECGETKHKKNVISELKAYLHSSLIITFLQKKVFLKIFFF